MQVLKFGGTSVATADNISKVISIVNKAVKKDRTILVCSAISKCTDALIAIGGTAAKRDEKYKNMIDVLQARHHEIISELLPPEYVSSVTKTVDQLFDSLRGIAYGVYLLGGAVAYQPGCHPELRRAVLDKNHCRRLFCQGY